MKNEVSDKVQMFLQNLRCEDESRKTLVHLDSYRIEAEKLEELLGDYKKVIEKLEISDKAIIEAYIEQISSTSFAQQQEAYAQGIFDAFQILCGLGILSPNANVENIIANLKNGSPQ